MSDQTVTDNASGTNKFHPFLESDPRLATPVINNMQVDVTKLPAKTPKKKISAKRKAEKAAKATLKEFKKIIKRELRDTFKVTSLLSFALKQKSIAEYNLEGVINKAFEDCMLRLNKRKNLTDANKKAAAGIFTTTFLNLKSFKLGESINEESLVLGKGKKKISKTEKVLSPKEKKKAKKSPAMKSLDKIKKDLVAVGTMKPEKKSKKTKPSKKANPKLDNHSTSA